MQQDQNTSLFGLGIDHISRSHLSEAARWARFLAICGFIFLGLLIIYGVFISLVFASMTNKLGDFENTSNSSNLNKMMGVGMLIFYIICTVIAFFPYYFLLRFANKMKAALISNDQEELNSSFQNLKILYRYMGILMIISLALIAFGIVSMIATTVMLAGR